jgi:uncharacterized membrane protein
LLRLGPRHLEIEAFRDSDGELRLVIPFPAWADLVLLAFDEICAYGATSMQVMRPRFFITDTVRVEIPSF